MSPAPTPPPADHADERARNGGTSAPRGGSVWDAAPLAPDLPAPANAAASTTATAATDAPAVAPTPEPLPAPDSPTTRPDPEPERRTEPLLGAASTVTIATTAKVAAPSVPAAPKRAVPQTPNARQREKARQAIAAAAAGQPVRTGPSLKTLIAVGVGLVLALTLSVVAWVVLLGGDTEAAVPVGTLATRASASTTTLQPAELAAEVPAIAAPAIAVAPPTTLAPSTTAAPTTTAVPDTTVAPTTTIPTTTIPTTTTPTTTTPTTTIPTTTTVAAVAGPRIVIEPRREGCKFGSDCLVAGFTIVDFAVQPDSFVCEFADGSRYTIPLEHRSVSYACATGSRGDSITIEIDGIRSDTAVHD